MKKHPSAGSIAAIAVGVAVVAAVIYIMVCGLGLNPDLDFGAGAYYYADIPAEEYHEIDPDGAYHTSVPKWVFYVLFLAWGWLMWRLWCKITK